MPQVYELTIPAGLWVDQPGGNQRSFMFLPSRGDDPADCNSLRIWDSNGSTTNDPADADRLASLSSIYAHSTYQPSATLGGNVNGLTLWMIYQVWYSWADYHTYYSSIAPWIPGFKDFAAFKSAAAPGEWTIDFVDDTAGDYHGQGFFVHVGGLFAFFSFWETGVNGGAPSDTAMDPVTAGTYYIEYSAFDSGASLASYAAGKLGGAAIPCGAAGSQLTVGNSAIFAGASDPTAFEFSQQAYYVAQVAVSAPVLMDLAETVAPGVDAASGDWNVLTFTADDGTIYADEGELEAVFNGATLELVGGADYVDVDGVDVTDTSTFNVEIEVDRSVAVAVDDASTFAAGIEVDRSVSAAVAASSTLSMTIEVDRSVAVAAAAGSTLAVGIERDVDVSVAVANVGMLSLTEASLALVLCICLAECFPLGGGVDPEAPDDAPGGTDDGFLGMVGCCDEEG